MRKLMTVALAALLTVAPAFAAEESDNAAEMQKFMQSLHFKSGTIALPGAKASLKLAGETRFLDAKDTERVLTELWGNPPGHHALGMVVPSESALADAKSYGVVVTFNEDGYVSDEDASKIDYDKMLSEMKDGTKEENEERKSAGYDAIELVGWAEKPHYDPAAKKIYWAKELSFEGADHHTVNYDVRVLGRAGYLSLNAVAGMEELPAIKAGMPSIISAAEFDGGARYADYQPGSDKLAAYGLAALVAGGVAAKAGLFGKLAALLIAGKKLVAVAALGIAAGFKKISGMIKRKAA
jgi:uncharacterized membrane-anchored protein